MMRLVRCVGLLGLVLCLAGIAAASLPGEEGRGDDPFAQGLRDFNRGQYTQAIASFRQAARLYPRNDLLTLHLGVVYANLRQYDEAIGEFQKAVSLNTDNVLALFLLEGAYLEKGMRAQAASTYQSAKRLFSKVDGIIFRSDRDVINLEGLLERYPEDAIGESLLGDAFQLQERIDEAIIHYRRAAALAPRWVKPHFNLGMACLGRDPARAIEAFRTVLRLDPENLKANLWLGDAYTYSNRYDKAMEAYSQAQRQAPEMPEISQRVGQLHLKAGQYPQAERELRKATRQAPRDPLNRVRLGEALAAQGRPDEAIQEYNIALQRADAEQSRTVLVMSYLGLASAYEAKGQPRTALKNLEKAAILDRAHAATYLREAGQIAERQNNRPQAIYYWKGSLEADPEADDWATARILQSKGLLQGVIADYEQALSRQQNNIALLTALSGLCRFQGSLQRALALTRKIVSIAPNRLSGWVALGQIYEQMGNPSQAANAYRRAIIVQPRLPKLRQLLEKVEGQR